MRADQKGQPPPVMALQEGAHSARASAVNTGEALLVGTRFLSIRLGEFLRSPEVLNWSAAGTRNSPKMKLQNLANHPRNFAGVLRLTTAAIPGVTNQ